MSKKKPATRYNRYKGVTVNTKQALIDRDIMERINTLKEPVRSIVYKRYVLGLTWEQIDDETGYNSDTVFMMYRAGIEQIKGV